MNLCHFYVIRIWNLFPFIRFIIPFSAPHLKLRNETSKCNDTENGNEFLGYYSNLTL